MKKLISIISILFSTCSPAMSQWYSGLSGGVAFAKVWDGTIKEYKSFAPAAIFINVPVQYKHGSLLAETNFNLTGSINVGAGIEIANFLQILGGATDYPVFNVMHQPIGKWQMTNYIYPSFTTRILIGNHVYLEGNYSNGITYLSIGLHTRTNDTGQY